MADVQIDSSGNPNAASEGTTQRSIYDKLVATFDFVPFTALVGTALQSALQKLADLANAIGNGVFDNRWVDVPGRIGEGDKKGALTWEVYRSTLFLMGFMRSDQGDELFFEYQMPHEWALTAVYAHIHFVPMANSAGKFAVKGEYAWVQNKVEIPDAAGWTSFTADFDLVAGDQHKEQIISVGGANGISPPSNASASNILLMRWMRDYAGGGGADTYTATKSPGTGAANIGLVSADCHVQVNKAGTVSQGGEG